VRFELRALALGPQRHSMHNAIEQRSTIAAAGWLYRPRNAHEPALKHVSRHPDGGVPIAIEIEKRQVGRKLRVLETSRSFNVARWLIFQRGFNAVTRMSMLNVGSNLVSSGRLSR
jgi:hypothetical protein